MGGIQPARLIVLVTGSRLYDDAWTIKATLDQVAADVEEENVDQLVIRHGACYPPPDPITRRIPARSADWLTHLWIERFAPALPIEVVEQERPADWNAPCRAACQSRTHRDRTVHHRRPGRGGTYCPMAGVYRNEAMVREDPHPDLGVAFLRDNSSGTRHCITAMREFGIPVEEIPYLPQGASR
jgi:hypothetical protein